MTGQATGIVRQRYTFFDRIREDLSHPRALDM